MMSELKTASRDITESTSTSIQHREAEIIAHQISIEIDTILQKHDAKLYLGSDKIFVSVERTIGTDEKLTATSQIDNVD